MSRRLLLASIVLVALALAACEPLPAPFTRIVSAEPAAPVRRDAVQVVVRFSGPVAADGVADGRHVALCRRQDRTAVARAAESEAGVGPGTPVIPVRLALHEGALGLTLVPDAPLDPDSPYALVVASRVRAEDGRPVLDPEGRLDTFVHEFRTEPDAAPPFQPTTSPPLPPGPPPEVALTEVLSDAEETPDAGGEYVEVWNAGDVPLDLTGFALAKRGTTGAFTRCTVAPVEAGATVAPGALALLVGGAWDRRYAVPAGTTLWRCGATGLAGGLADDRAPAVQLEDPAGVVLSTLGVQAAAPRCAEGALERVDPAGADEAGNLACAGAATPGACNRSTPPERCPGFP